MRVGIYAPPEGWPLWPRLECAGMVLEAPANGRFKLGDRVCALLGGGGYAEQVVVPEGMCLPLPKGFESWEAAGLRIVPRHWEKEKTIRDFTPDEIASIRSVLVTAKERPIDAQSCTQLALTIYEIMNAILNATTERDIDQDLVSCCCDLLARNIENYHMLWVLHRLGLEDGENPMTWRFIQDVKNRTKAPQSIKTIQGDGSVSVSSSKVIDKLDAMLNSE